MMPNKTKKTRLWSGAGDDDEERIRRGRRFAWCLASPSSWGKRKRVNDDRVFLPENASTRKAEERKQAKRFFSQG